MSNAIVSALNLLQADYAVFYQKLRGYHWTVTGPMFFQLHQKFEELYLDMAIKVDDLAERSLTLGGSPVTTIKGMIELSRLHEDAEPPNAAAMVRTVYTDLNLLTVWNREVAALAAKEDDVATANLLEGMADTQEKEAWMLRAFLES
ncbi:MAG: DNA starvation/stationary phase protection protein [bacterium]|nr:DNA starvation/stationary phase protection protein [bacterium]